MAIDTVRKRLSMMNFADGTTIYATLFVPDGTVALDDKQHLLDCYGGIAFAGAPAGRILNLIGVGGLIGPGVLIGEGGLVA